MNKAAMNNSIQVSAHKSVCISLGKKKNPKTLKNAIARSYGKPTFNLKINHPTIFRAAFPFYIRASNVWMTQWSSFSTSSLECDIQCASLMHMFS